MKILTVNEYLKNTYGKKMYKLALSCSDTCPNRDGTTDTCGCIFCPNGASDGFAQSCDMSVTAQIENAERLVANKNKNGGYIAYFQTFTSTYAPIQKLRKCFYEAARHPDIDIISIATRPDCLGNDVIDLIKEINAIKPVWVELGLQTINPKTAEYIRRWYSLDVYDKAVCTLKQTGVHIIVHLILGLPYETKQDMIQSADYVGKSGVHGVKLQLLHVLKGCDLEKEYNEGKFETLTLEQYADILCECLRVLPENTVIHRLTGDGAKKYLVAPLWSADKKKVMNYINKRIADY